MSSTHFKGQPVELSGKVPQVGDKVTDFSLTGLDLTDFNIDRYKGRRLVMNIFPSIDTGICAMSVRRFNKEASSLENTRVLNISRDLPFAQKRFCGAEGIENVDMGSDMRPESNFGQEYGLVQMGGPLAGTLGRVVLVLDADHTVIHSEVVPEITQEPDYEAALKVLA
jgi:thiol peroxidase